MTAWQDQPPLGSKPLSRRQARQSERGGDTDGQVDVAKTSAEQPDFTNFAREGWDAQARRVAAATPPSSQQQQPTSRRSQRSLQAVEPSQALEAAEAVEPTQAVETTQGNQALPEPLEYLTQGRPQAPSTDGQQFRRRSVSAVDNEIPTAAPAYRVRDFSPEGRPSFSSTMPEAFAASPSASEMPEHENEDADNAGSENLEYRTQGTIIPARPRNSVEAPVAEAPRPVAPEAAAEVAQVPVPEERTLSRRELRAMEAANRGTAAKPPVFDPFGTPTPAGQVAEVEPEPVAPEPVAPELIAPEFIEPASVLPVPALVEPAPPAQPLRRDRIRQLSTELDNSELGNSELANSEQDSRAADALAEFDALTAAAPATEAAAPATESAAPTPWIVQPLAYEPPPFAAAPAAPSISAPSEPSTWTPPTGHWSTQALIDDDEQIQENTLSRNVGATSGAITTNALVIPTPPSIDMTRPLGSTGEILITGTIDLPRSFGSTGAHPARYDHSDVDTLLEAGDREDNDANPDSAPVRAIRAVSTHASTRGVMDAKKPKGISRLPLVLGVAATVLAVGVVALVIAAVVFGVFK